MIGLTVTVVADDRPGLLATISAALVMSGLDVIEAEAYTLDAQFGCGAPALDKVRAIYEVGGKGHSCGIYSFDDDHIDRLAQVAPVSRIMVRQPNVQGNAGSTQALTRFMRLLEASMSTDPTE